VNTSDGSFANPLPFKSLSTINWMLHTTVKYRQPVTILLATAIKHQRKYCSKAAIHFFVCKSDQKLPLCKMLPEDDPESFYMYCSGRQITKLQIRCFVIPHNCHMRNNQSQQCWITKKIAVNTSQNNFIVTITIISSDFIELSTVL